MLFRSQLSGHNYNGPSEVPYYHDEDEKAELLRNCIALKDHRKEIATFFAGHENRKERGNFIKSFFDNTYVEHILESGQRVGYRAYDDLLTMWRGSYLSREKEDFISWERIANKIYGLILLNEWLSPDEQLLTKNGDITFSDAAFFFLLCKSSKMKSAIILMITAEISLLVFFIEFGTL